MFDVGDKVFGKLRFFPPWPAKILHVIEYGNRVLYTVHYYGSGDTGNLKRNQVMPFAENKALFEKKIKAKNWLLAMNDIMTDLTDSEKDHLHKMDISSLEPPVNEKKKTRRKSKSKSKLVVGKSDLNKIIVDKPENKLKIKSGSRIQNDGNNENSAALKITEEDIPVKKKRGRPAKTISNEYSAVEPTISVENSTIFKNTPEDISVGMKKRGRPKKRICYKNISMLKNTEDDIPARKKRGRPAKTISNEYSAVEPTISVENSTILKNTPEDISVGMKKRGRPKKCICCKNSSMLENTEDDIPVKKKRGIPAKTISNEYSAVEPTISVENSTILKNTPEDISVGMKKRGRPKQCICFKNSEMLNNTEDDFPMIQKKRRRSTKISDINSTFEPTIPFESSNTKEANSVVKRKRKRPETSSDENSTDEPAVYLTDEPAVYLTDEHLSVPECPTVALDPLAVDGNDLDQQVALEPIRTIEPTEAIDSQPGPSFVCDERYTDTQNKTSRVGRILKPKVITDLGEITAKKIKIDSEIIEECLLNIIKHTKNSDTVSLINELVTLENCSFTKKTILKLPHIVYAVKKLRQYVVKNNNNIHIENANTIRKIANNIYDKFKNLYKEQGTSSFWNFFKNECQKAERLSNIFSHVLSYSVNKELL